MDACVCRDKENATCALSLFYCLHFVASRETLGFSLYSNEVIRLLNIVVFSKFGLFELEHIKKTNRFAADRMSCSKNVNRFSSALPCTRFERKLRYRDRTATFFIA